MSESFLDQTHLEGRRFKGSKRQMLQHRAKRYGHSDLAASSPAQFGPAAGPHLQKSLGVAALSGSQVEPQRTCSLAGLTTVMGHCVTGLIRFLQGHARGPTVFQVAGPVLDKLKGVWNARCTFCWPWTMSSDLCFLR